MYQGARIVIGVAAAGAVVSLFATVGPTVADEAGTPFAAPDQSIPEQQVGAAAPIPPQPAAAAPEMPTAAATPTTPSTVPIGPEAQALSPTVRIAVTAARVDAGQLLLSLRLENGGRDATGPEVAAVTVPRAAGGTTTCGPWHADMGKSGPLQVKAAPGGAVEWTARCYDDAPTGQVTVSVRAYAGRTVTFTGPVSA